MKEKINRVFRREIFETLKKILERQERQWRFF